MNTLLSLIVCSRTPALPPTLVDNLEDTLGVPYETVVIDNSRNEYSIFAAYNEGIRRAQGDYLCFMHEDLIFHTKGWGQTAIAYLNNPETGLIALAGAVSLPAFPTTWFLTRPVVENLIQSDRQGREEKRVYTSDQPYRVLGIDGFWFCARREIFQKISFDEQTYSGFHFYDMDIAMQVFAKGYQTLIIHDIVVEHCSHGSLNVEWLQTMYVFFNKWKDHLPATVPSLLKKRIFAREQAFGELLFYHRKLRLPLPAATWRTGWKQLRLGLLLSVLYKMAKQIKHTCRL